MKLKNKLYVLDLVLCMFDEKLYFIVFKKDYFMDFLGFFFISKCYVILYFILIY